MTDQGEQNKSEQPTSYKLARARSKGSVARGIDLGYATALAALLIYVWFAGTGLVERVEHAAVRALVVAPDLAIGSNAILEVAGQTFMTVARPMLLMGAIIFLTVLVFDLVQTGVVFSTDPLRPDFHRLNPTMGFKRVFSVRTLIETLKSILKLLLYAAVAAAMLTFAIGHAALEVFDAQSLANVIGRMAFRLLACVVGAAVVFAAADQLIVRRDFLKRMRMSRREIRRETRDREGDARMKQRRKRLHAEFVKQSQSLRGVRGADILVTNPTHYAVALRYDHRTMVAPSVVSQGADRLAIRLKRLAFLYGVVIVEHPVLARALYHGAKFNQQIPEKLYRPVADLYLANRDFLSQKQRSRAS